jgi:hypothetical protein
LDAVGEAHRNVIHEPCGAIAIAPADEMGNDQLRLRFDRGPGPSVARAIGSGFRSLDVLRLRVGEGPDFIDLDALRFTLRTLASWKPAQKRPASSRSFDTVLILTSAKRETERIEAPSQSMARIWARWATGSLFKVL